MSAGSDDPWGRELDEMESHLEAHREAFSRRSPDAPPPRRPMPTDVLGPLPESLRDRAEELLRATRAFEGEVLDARAALSASLRHSGRTTRPMAAYVDARA